MRCHAVAHLRTHALEHQRGQPQHSSRLPRRSLSCTAWLPRHTSLHAAVCTKDARPWHSCCGFVGTAQGASLQGASTVMCGGQRAWRWVQMRIREVCADTVRLPGGGGGGAGAWHPQAAAGLGDGQHGDVGHLAAVVHPQHLQPRVTRRQRRHSGVPHCGAPARWQRPGGYRIGVQSGTGLPCSTQRDYTAGVP